jgi:eukaryotic-like serine/threonine-protein kinase
MPHQTFHFSNPPKPSKQVREVFRIESAGSGSGPGTSYAFKVTVLLFLFMGLLGGGGFLMHYLSKHPIGTEDAPPKKMPQELKSKPERPTPPEPEDTGEMEMAKKGAQQSMGAKKGLAKAEKAEAVARLLLSGKKNETENNLPFALTDYQQARKMDPESVQAQQAFQRVKRLIIEDEFRNLMSTGLTALHRDDFDGARSSFLKARGLRPASQEVRDALGQVDQTRRLFRLKRHQKEALDAELSEDWDRALAAYTAALEIDPRVRFAAQGKEHSLEIIQISKRIAFYLNKPEVLESDKYLEKAVQLLSDAEGKVPKGSQLKAEQEKLRHLVQTAQIPLTITLESDNLTRVAVYRVGRLGTFLKNDLTLRPGTYTIVGTRNGYRDVRRRVVLKPGQPLRVTIICREKI